MDPPASSVVSVSADDASKTKSKPSSNNWKHASSSSTSDKDSGRGVSMGASSSSSGRSTPNLANKKQVNSLTVLNFLPKNI